MGFMWSKPTSSLEQTLIDEPPMYIFRSGDILLTRADELAIVMHQSLWSHVAVIVMVATKMMVFVNGHFEPLDTYLNRRPRSFVRRLECHRPSGFDAQMFSAAQVVSDKILQRMKINQDVRESYAAFHILKSLNLADSDYEPESIRPHHFSSDTPFKRLELRYYGQNEPI